MRFLHHLMRRGRGERGYTLIEMITVATIIGILAAMAIAAVAKARVQAREKAAVAQLKGLANGYQTYFVRNGQYPHWGPGQTFADTTDLWNGLASQGYFPTPWTYYQPDPVSGFIFGPFEGYVLEIPEFQPDSAGLRDTSNYFALVLRPSGFQQGYLAMISDPAMGRPGIVPLSSSSPDINTFSLYHPAN